MKILIVTKYFAHRFKPKQKHVGYPHSSFPYGIANRSKLWLQTVLQDNIPRVTFSKLLLQLCFCASSSNRKAGEYLNCCFTFIQRLSLDQF